MKILHVITSLRTGGAEKLMVDLLPRLRDFGNEVTLCVFDGIETPFKSQLKKMGIPIVSLGYEQNVYHPKFIIKLKRLIKKGNFDIVHTHNTSPQLFAALANSSLKSKLITTEHNTTNRRRGNPIFALLDKWMYAAYRRIICISEMTANNLKAATHITPELILTIPNGIDVAKYSEANPTHPMLIGDEITFRILQVAAFREQKDQDTTIRAMQHLPEPFHLFLVGDGVRRHHIESLIRELKLEKRVHLLGVQTQVAEIIAEADLVAMSSHWEGFGLAAAEGMAAGKPVIASNVDGLAQVVEGAGLLFEKGNDKQLAQLILQLSEDKERYKSIAEKCRQRAKHFDISKMAEAYQRVYREINGQN